MTYRPVLGSNSPRGKNPNTTTTPYREC